MGWQEAGPEKALRRIEEARKTRTPSLNLAGCGLQEIPDAVFDLNSLESLDLGRNRIASVPKGICRLKKLRHLYLQGCGICEIPSWIVELAQLETLNVAWNDLQDLPDSLGDLASLRLLYLDSNPLPHIPPGVFKLKQLTGLSIMSGSSGGRLRGIPREILQLGHLRELRVGGQPIETPPPEIVRQGVQAIKNFWRQEEEVGVDYLCEAKLLIVGEAGAGKTSLAKKICDRQYQLQPTESSTEGIEVLRWKFPAAVRVKDQDKLHNCNFHVNIWDFGGQEVYYSTHQFFLTKRSLYALVADERKEDTDFNYWLEVVALLSGGSPILIVQNEKQGRRRDVNIASLRGRFENLLGAYTVDLATNRELDPLVDVLRQQLEWLPHIGTPLPKTWRRVREALEKDKRDYIGLSEYLALCDEHGFRREEDKLQLSGYLHDLGICLHFQNDPVLKHTVILKPKWGTDAVYRVLDDAEVKASRGRFSDSDLARIWSEPKYAPMRHELLRLMMNFELCYALPGQQSYIAPQLLSPSQPHYEWPYPETLILRYDYDFMPKGMLTRLIVALHRRIASQDLVWKTGVILERNDTRAEMIEDYGRRRITMRLGGAETRGLLAIADEELDRIHATFPNLNYEKYVPCNCVRCNGRDDAFTFSLETLKDFAKERDQIQCQKSRKMVDAADLIRDIFPSVARELDSPRGLEHLLAPSTTQKQVYVSYSWIPDSNAIIDEIEKALAKHDIRLFRDRNEIKYRQGIREFVRNLGRGNAIVVVLSKAYLESKSCMFELTEIAEHGNVRGRVFPIVMPDANIYSAADRLRYVRFWEEKRNDLDAEMKQVGGENLHGIREELDLFAKIRATIAGITDILGDMNALTLEQHRATNFADVVRAVEPS